MNELSAAEFAAARNELDKELGEIEITPEEINGATEEATYERLLVRVEDHRRDSVVSGVDTATDIQIDRVRKNQVALADVRKRKKIVVPSTSRPSTKIDLAQFGIVEDFSVSKSASTAVDAAFGPLLDPGVGEGVDDFMSESGDFGQQL